MAITPIKIRKGRTENVYLGLGFDVSNDTFTSEVRVDKDPTSELIGEWDVTFLTDGTDGEIVLTMDDSVTALIDRTTGWMDIKRVSDGEPYAVFDEPIPVVIAGTVTA